MISPSIIPTAMPHGYNASIAAHGGNRLMSYRYHPNPSQWRTHMMIQEHGDDWVKESHVKLPEKYADMSHEDGRFFVFNRHLCMSLTVALFPGVIGVPPPCATVYGMLAKKDEGWELEHVVQPKFGDNNFDGQSKNNLFFEHGGKLHQIYQCSPEQIVVRLKENGDVDEVYRTKSPSWEHGEIRGGTQPLSFVNSGKWLRFFHSLFRYGKNRQDWSYAIGALIQDSKPPFQIERISSYPVFSGDERFVPHCKHHKAGCAIPYGAIVDGEGWIVSIGMNDCMTATLKVQESDLHL